MENPANIIRSWNRQTNFAMAPVAYNKLVPPPFSRIATNYVQTWREEQCRATLDFGSANHSYYIPQGLQVISALYLQIELPVLGSSAYKKYPGLYAIKTIRLLSGSKEIYTCDYKQFLHDHCQSLSNECLKVFAKTYLGHQDTMDATARTVMLPILLPNSAYLDRNGPSTRGHGIWPCQLGNTNRLEIQVTLNAGNFLTADTSVSAGSISGACKWLYHEVNMTSANTRQYAQQLGTYSIINRRFTELTNGWQTYATPDTKATWNINQPQGVVTEVMLIAVPTAATEDRYECNYVKPTKFKIIADTITQKDLDTSTKIDAELWSNGFCPPDDFPCPGRLCFAAHTGKSSHLYSGGYNQQLVSTISYEFEFAEAVKWKLVAVQLQRVSIQADGKVVANLE